MVVVPALTSGSGPRSGRVRRVFAYVAIFFAVVVINGIAISRAPLFFDAIVGRLSRYSSQSSQLSVSKLALQRHQEYGGNSSSAKSWTEPQSFYSVCILSSIGDDSQYPNDKAVPFPLLYRLFDAGKEEIEKHLSRSVDRIVDNRAVKDDLDSRIKLLVVVDYPSLVCNMARDSIQDGGLGLRGVEVTCKSMEQLLQDGTHAPNVSDSSRISCETAVVGKSTRYVPQLTVDLAQSISWKSLKVVNFDAHDVARDPPRLPRESWRPTIVTAFSSNHFAVGLLLLRSLGKAGMEAAKAGQYNISIVVYTMENFNSTLQGILECQVQELNENYKVPTELRAFDFSAHPEWMRINQSMGMEGLGKYAWKVVMIHSVLVERGFILWTDAGCRYTAESLIETLNYTRKFGFASKSSSGAVPQYVHPGLIKYLRYPVRYGSARLYNCDASGIGLTLDTYETIGRPFFDCGVTRQCIAPDGATRDNHRFDQAALTLIVDINGASCTGLSSKVKRHMDYRPLDYSGTFPTYCYKDPLVVLEEEI